MLTMKTMRFLVGILAGLIVPAVASARDFTPQGYAARTGISFSPDQFQAGVHLQLGEGTRPQIRPVVELGMGNGLRLVSLAGDVLYHFEGKQWRPYAGGGPGLNFVDVTDGVGQADGLETKLVAHAVTGVTWAPRRSRYRYFLEGRVGFGDTHDFRLGLGLSF